METAKLQRKELYLAFIDFRKAFDTVDRQLLWETLGKIGLDSNTIDILKSLYKTHKRKIHTINGWTDWIDCSIGVKQGCTISPLLFSLFISDLSDKLNQKRGWPLGNDYRLGGLLFADDLIIIATSRNELSNQLSQLGAYAENKHLQINAEKSLVMTLNKNNSTVQPTLTQNWSLQEGSRTIILPEGDSYKYLGIRLGNQTRKRHSHQKSHCMGILPKLLGFYMYKAKDISPDIEAQIRLWQNIYKPLLTFGSEIIIYDKQWINKLISAQHKIGCFILKLPTSTNQAGVRGELGWSSIQGDLMLAKLRYKTRIL